MVDLPLIKNSIKSIYFTYTFDVMGLKRINTYWWCQIIGWIIYGLTMIFFAFVFNQPLTTIFYLRLAVSIIIGFAFTHIFREVIKQKNILPPLQRNNWMVMIFLVLMVCLLYSSTNSAVVEWLRLYNPKIKVSFQKRFLFNFFNDSPIIIVWVAIYYVWHYIEIGRSTEIDQVRLKTLVKELELKTIKSHINPHFIFNALNSIRALVDENPSRARTAITELSNILRSSMQAEKVETAPLEKELNIVKDYLALEHIRFEDRLKVEYEIDEDTLDQPILPMMLQTLVENAIKHGISQQIDGGVVKIISDFKESHHELIVQNTGKLPDDINTNGFGISSTKNMLELVYGSNASFELKELPNNIVEAKVILPIADL